MMPSPSKQDQAPLFGLCGFRIAFFKAESDVFRRRAVTTVVLSPPRLFLRDARVCPIWQSRFVTIKLFCRVLRSILAPQRRKNSLDVVLAKALVFSSSIATCAGLRPSRECNLNYAMVLIQKSQMTLVRKIIPITFGWRALSKLLHEPSP